MKKVEKSFFVQNLAEELKAASSVVLIDYSGLSVKMQQDLKKRLKEVESKMLVVKNTLFKLAGVDAKISKEVLTDTVLTGPNALVFTEADPIAPLQVLGKFAKENEIPQLKVGVVEGSFQDKEELIALSKLPSKDALVGQVIGTIAAPTYGIVNVLQTNLQKLVYVLNEKAKGGE
jgi:large subunit ribosomal protein L10